MTPRQYIREALRHVEIAIGESRNALDQIADTPARLALGQAVLRLEDAQHELRCATELAQEAKIP